MGTPTQTEVAIEPDGGTFAVSVKINDTISLKFTIDSGASYVNTPADVASTLVRAGTIAEADFIGDQTFMLADGSTVPSALFRIRSLKIGTLELHDVVGSIGGAKGPLLLGQRFLTRLTTFLGVLDWTAANPATRARSTGVAQFMFGFRNGLIEVEGGKVLSRG